MKEARKFLNNSLTKAELVSEVILIKMPTIMEEYYQERKLMDKERFTLQDMKHAWDSADDYREQIERIYAGNSNLIIPTHMNKADYFKKIEENL